MGLVLPQEVEITLNSTTMKYYESKGYSIPKINKTAKRKDGSIYCYKNQYITPKDSTIKVKVEDLPIQSNIKVDVKCDFCGKQHKILYCNYTKCNHDGKYFCRSCAMQELNSRENHPLWNFNKTDEERIIERDYPEYHAFVKSCLARDNYVCQFCKTGNKKLVVHHLDGYDWCKEGRTDVTNGVTLCTNCHLSFHSHYGFGSNTKEQFKEWTEEKNIILKAYEGQIPSARWAYCLTDNEIIENVANYAKERKLKNSHIYSCCNKKIDTYHNKIYLWYDEYVLLSKEQITEMLARKESNKRRVACINYKLLFNSATCGAIYFNTDSSSILKCCKGRNKSSGKSKDGERLIWKYASDIENLEDYSLIPDEKIKLATK